MRSRTRCRSGGRARPQGANRHSPGRLRRFSRYCSCCTLQRAFRGWWRVERSSGACRSLAAVMDCGLQVHVAEERLEHEQGPDRGAVVADAAAMLVQQALDEAHVEEVDLLEEDRKSTRLNSSH